MGYLPSARAQVKDGTSANVIPDSAQLPAAHTDFLKIVNAMEPRLVLRLPNIGVASTAPYSLVPLEVGMFVVTTTDPSEIWLRTAKAGGTWQKIWPTIYNGTTPPAAGLGVDDDLYIMY